MKHQKLALAVFITLGLLSCKKEADQGFGPVGSTAEMKVPKGFDYNTTRNIDFHISTASVWSKQKIRVDIYDYLPTAGGDLISSQFMDGFGEIEGKLEVPASIKNAYVVLTNPDGSSQMAVVDASSNHISYSFAAQQNLKKVVVVSPDCTTGCGQVVNNNSNWIDANNGGVYCFTGSISGGINAKNGSTVRICGSGSFQLDVESNAKVEIVDGANVTITNFNVKSTADKVTIYPNAIVSVTNWATPNSLVVNHGTLTFANLGIGSSGSLINNGTLVVTGTQWYTVDGSLTNNASMIYNGNLTLNTTGSIKNYCSMSVAKKLTLDTVFDNYGYVKVDNQLQINSSGNMKLHDGAMTETKNLYVDGTIVGLGSTSLMKLSNTVAGNSSAKIKGNLEFCDANGVEPAFSGQFISPAVQACNVYIPTNSCNSVGNGTPQVADADNDGVADQNDLFPNDPTVSGASYYPSNGNYATLLFEDLWPGQGDYDFNDLVLNYKYSMLTNASNQVVRIETQIIVKAIGGSFKNGFGFQLDLSPSVVASVTGQRLSRNIVSNASNGTEQGQSKATIIAFDDAREGIKNYGGTIFVNTIASEAHKDADTLNLVVTFTSPQSLASLGVAPYNPFIFVNGDRGKEIHLPDYAPTDLMNSSYFGVSADDSKPSAGRYFKTEKNLPWAINVGSDIDYPQEKMDIVQAYNYFAAWAQSSGSQSADWYLDLAGYRNPLKMY